MRAWIETATGFYGYVLNRGSPAVCGRGLKHAQAHCPARTSQSPAVCGRGLKPLLSIASSGEKMSPAVCGRGLKPRPPPRAGGDRPVARRVRAWIETTKMNWQVKNFLSPAVCGRGLKQAILKRQTPDAMSPAVCGRGLKLLSSGSLSIFSMVARRVRAWIETSVR